MSVKRTRLSPVYLTATERDTVRQALEFMASELEPARENGLYRPTIWARSFTRQRLLDITALFAAKATGEQA